MARYDHDDQQMHDDLGLEAEMPGKIKVICHGCGAHYQVRSTKVRGRRFRATCKKCGGIIVAHCTDAFTVMPGGNSIPGRPAAALQLDRDDLDHDEECSWYAVIAGKPHGPMNYGQIRRAFEQGHISVRTYLWRAGDPEWRRLSEVADFAGWAAEQLACADEQGGAGLDQQPTSETRAAGPQGLRRQANNSDPPAYDDDSDAPASDDVNGPQAYDVANDADYDDSAEEPTAFFRSAPQSDDEMPDEATKLHVKDQPDPAPHAHSPPQPAPQPPPQPQAAWKQVPVMPPRKAVLPSPSGSPMRPVAASAEAPGDPNQPEEHTRPLSESERVKAGLPQLPGGEVGPDPEPPNGGPPTPAAGLPPLQPLPAVPSEQPALTPALGPQQPSVPVVGQPGQAGHLLAPVAEEEPFWTTGKIAAAAAIGGGLAVALAVMLVVSLLRPKEQTLEELPKTPNVQASQQEIKRTEEEANPKPKSQKLLITINPPPETPAPEQAQTEQDQRAPKQRSARAKSSKKRRPAARRAPRRHTRRRSTPASNTDVDAILSAGTRSRKRTSPKPASEDADSILAAGSRTRKRRPSAVRTRLSQEQILSSIRRVLPYVRRCHDKYGVKGLVKVRVTVSPKGRPTGRVLGKFASTPTGFCVLGGVNRARFPSFTGKPITFTYPFRLQ